MILVRRPCFTSCILILLQVSKAQEISRRLNAANDCHFFSTVIESEELESDSKSDPENNKI